MKVRNIKISIKSEEELFNEVNDAWKKLEKGEKTKKHEGISFESFEAMRKVLTEERLRILKVIKKDHPQSIYDLAQAGLIELKKTKDGREKTTPIVNYDKILLEIPV
jgi:predicted transcriptional regulator